MVFFFNDTATTEIYTLSLHDALPISGGFAETGGRGDEAHQFECDFLFVKRRPGRRGRGVILFVSHNCRDRKSTRLNSSHQIISYAVFCLKKKTNHSTLQSPLIDADTE